MKVYITKYALTRGIMSVDGDVSGSSPDMFVVSGRPNQFFHKGEWFEDWNAADRRAYDLQRAKIISLEKAIKKLKAMEFERPK